MIPPLATQHEAATKETNNKDNTNDKETEDKNTDNEEKEFLKHIQELTYNATVNQNHEGQLKDLQAIRNNNIASIKQETTQINQISIVSNVSDITSLTPIILFQLHNIETIIGTPTDKNTLAENFVKACNGQCTNA